MKLLVKNINRLVGVEYEPKPRRQGKEMDDIQSIDDAWLLVEEGRFAQFGTASEGMPALDDVDETLDAEGGMVLPSWCDSHTHIVFAGSREREFVDKINGLSYEEIARRGGGILNSADLLHRTSEEELFQQAMRRLDEMVRKGTGCIEIKSGYGLNLDDELKMLRVIQRMKQASPAKIVATFLGAHAVARGMTQADYVKLVVNEMLPEVGRQRLADFVDVFCDRGFFTPKETDQILSAAAAWGMRPKIHADELASSGGVEVGVRRGALSVDHLESMTVEEIDLLRDSPTMPTLLPGTSFFLNMPYGKGRKMIDAGLAVAVASDYNPGSTPSGDMKFVVSLACVKLRLRPNEALNAATINGAYAMGESADYGSIAKGKVANFFITCPLPSVDFIPYAYTTPIVRQVVLGGKVQR